MEAIGITGVDYGFLLIGFAMGWLCAILGWFVRLIVDSFLPDQQSDLL